MPGKSRLAWFCAGILVAFWFLAFLPRAHWHQLSYGLAVGGGLVAALALAVGISAPLRAKADPRDVICAAAGLLVIALNLYLIT